MNNCKTILSSLDLIAPSLELTYQSRRRHGTLFGGVCSLAMMLLIAYLSLSQILRIFAEENLTVSQYMTT